MTAPDHVESSVAYRIVRAGRVLRRGFLALTRDHGLDLSPEQWWVLAQLREQDGCSQIDLSDDLFGDRPNVTRILARMERMDLVERRDDPADARRRLVFLTGHGRDIHDRMLEVARAERRRLFGALDAADLAATFRTLAALERAHR